MMSDRDNDTQKKKQLQRPMSAQILFPSQVNMQQMNDIDIPKSKQIVRPASHYQENQRNLPNGQKKPKIQSAQVQRRNETGNWFNSNYTQDRNLEAKLNIVTPSSQTMNINYDQQQQPYQTPQNLSRKDFTKFIPHYIKEDKKHSYQEKLYEENLQMKQELNNILQDNQIIKAKNHLLDKDNQKLQKLIGDVEVYLKQKVSSKNLMESIFVTRLRKQIKEQKKLIEEKNNELNMLKKNNVITKIREFQVENDILQKECIRLKSLLDQAIADNVNELISEDLDPKRDKVKKLFQATNFLRKDNQQQKGQIVYLSSEISQLEDKKNEYQKKIGGLTIKVQQQDQRLEEKQQKIRSQDKKIEMLENEIYQLKEQLSKVVEEEKNYNDLKCNNQKSLQKLQQQDEQIQNYQQQIKELKSQQIQNNKVEDDKDKQQLLEEIKMLKQKNEQLFEQQKKNQEKLTQQQINKEEQDLEQNRNDLIKLEKEQAKEIKQKQPDKGEFPFHKLNNKSLPTVKKKDVLQLGQEINLRLTLKKLKIENVIEWSLLDEKIKKREAILLSEVYQKLLLEPFQVSDPASALLLARYLVEQNDDDHVIFNEQAFIKITEIRSIFKTIVGNVKNYTLDEETQYHQQLVDIFEKHKDKIAQYLQGNDNSELKQTGKVTKAEIIEAIQYIEIPEFTEPLKEYYFLKLFERSNTISYYYFKDVQELFKPKIELKIKQKAQLQKKIENRKY